MNWNLEETIFKGFYIITGKRDELFAAMHLLDGINFIFLGNQIVIPL